MQAAASEIPALVEPIHTAVKGRVRYRIQALYRTERLKEMLETHLPVKKPVMQASANIRTGSLLVLFEPDYDLDEITTIVTELVRSAGGVLRCRQKAAPALRQWWDAPRPASTRPRPLSAPRHRPVSTLPETAPAGVDWHRLTAETVVERLESAADTGLSQAQAAERRRRDGPNVLPEAAPRSGFGIFVEQFQSLPVGLLAASAALSLVTGGLADALVILGVVLINGGIGYITESRAERTITALGRMTTPPARVRRDGELREIHAEDVVPGDVLMLAPGTYVAADARLLEVQALSVDESALTGESVPVAKSAARLDADQIPLADRINMVYMGTLVSGGQGLAVVVATGARTEIGRIQTLVGETRPPPTPMERQLDAMGRRLVLLSGAVCGAVFLLGLLRGYGFMQMLKTAISLAVAAVPEGLPTIATTTLALGIRDMRRHHVLIRRLAAVETLGAVQVICLDKTGTITMNRMSVTELVVGGDPIHVDDDRFLRGEERIEAGARPDLRRLLETVALCNDTGIEGDAGAWVLTGSPTENALMHLALGAGLDPAALRRTYPRLQAEYRAEGRHFMITMHAEPDGKRRLAVKGNPAQVLAMCARHAVAGALRPLSDDDRQTIEDANERMAGNALRVLGVAYAELDEEEAVSPNGLTWLGLVGMADPIRRGVRELLASFHQAGIETVMITGDQSSTAYAIGKAVELGGGEQLEILDSIHLEQLDPGLLTALAPRVHVFARVSPAHKLQIVQALQRAGNVVAMTGDGVNDGPALKSADVGIAMGRMGTDVARAVADVVLEDDQLQTMIIAIRQGRTIYGNIRKSIHFLLATNLSEILLMSGAIAAGMGQPLSPMQLLWINLVTDIFPGLALSFEKPEPDVLRRPPRNPAEPIIQRADLRRIGFEAGVIGAGALGAYGYGLARYGAGPRAGSMAFMTLTMAQLWHVASSRSESRGMFSSEKLPPNPYLNLALGGTFALQMLAALVPGLRRFLGLAPLRMADGLVIGAGALLPFIINEASKGKASAGGRP